MSDPVKNALLVLSDLHFGADFLLEAEIDPLQIPTLLKFVAPKIRNFFEARCRAHDMAILIALPRYLKKVLRELSREGLSSHHFGSVLLLGDLATYANGGSYVFLREYLSQENYNDSSGKKRTGIGGVHNGNLIAIPGNHDKLLRKNLDLYHTKFCLPLGIDPQPKPQSSYFTSRTINGQELIFALVEASRFASKDGKLDFDALSHLAGGKVSRILRDETKEKFEMLKAGKSVDRAVVTDYATARKILLVHYAVDDRVVLGPAPLPQELVVSHHCKGLDALVGDLSETLDLVIHGHLHRPKIYNHCGVPIVSATTTSQVNGENGFFVIKFLESGDIVPDYHRWDQNGFVKDQSAELKTRIARAVDPISTQSTMTMKAQLL